MVRLKACILASWLALAVASTLAVLGPPPYPGTARGTSYAESACQAAITRTLSPRDIRTCERSDVSLRVLADCPGDPLDVVLALIGYASPEQNPANRTWNAAAIDALQMSRHSNVKAGIVLIRGQGTILLDLTSDEDQVRLKSQVQYVQDYAPRDLSYASGLAKAAQVLSGAGPDDRKVIIYIGMMDLRARPQYYLDWMKGAGLAKAAADIFIVACPRPWVSTCKDWSNPPDWWRAASPGFYFEGTAPGAFAGAIKRLVAAGARTKLAAVTVDDQWPPGLALVPDSAVPPPVLVDAGNRRRRWTFTAPITQALTLTYEVQPLAIGAHQFVGGQTVITDTTKQTRVLPLPTGVLTVTGPCETPTYTPSPEPTPTFTAAPGPTATWTAIATATRWPAPLYLPLALGEQCVPGQQRVDVALAIDASTSMLLPADASHTKLDVAVDAAREFLDLLHLDGGDQAAVVAFNSAAALLAPLTADRATLDGALTGIETARQTCLLCAVDVGANELASARHKPANTPVLILLTDGQSNPRPASEAVARAAQAKQAGVVIFTIGLGADLDVAALASIASQPWYFYRAPTADELDDIYREIAVNIPCPAEQFWGRR